MNVKSVEKKEKNTAEISVEIAAEEFETAVNQAYRKNRNSISVPGFRKGKAPRKIIENIYGQQVFYEDALEIIYPDALRFAVDSEKLETVGMPTLLDVKFGEDKNVTIVYLVALYPEVTLGAYKGVSAPKDTVRVLKKDIDDEIENVRKRNARIQTVDRAAKDGDTANIDFEGFLDGKPFAGGKDEGFDLVLGSGSFVQGFEEQVVGMKAGESKDIHVTFPGNYTPELASKPVVFKVKVNEVKESILPAVDDEFAKDVSEYDTLEEYRASVKEMLTERRKNFAERAFEEAVMAKVITDMQCEIPDAMVDERVEQTLQNYTYNLQAQGMTMDGYLQMMGMKLDDFKATLRPSAEHQIKNDLVLEQVAREEKFEITDAELEEKYQSFADMYKMELDSVKKAIGEDALRQQIGVEKARELIISTAVPEKKKASKTEKPSADPAENTAGEAE